MFADISSGNNPLMAAKNGEHQSAASLMQKIMAGSNN